MTTCSNICSTLLWEKGRGVERDRYCLELDRLYPGYGIAKHKGYPTKAHMDAVRELGPSPCHRKSFLKFLKND